MILREITLLILELKMIMILLIIKILIKHIIMKEIKDLKKGKILTKKRENSKIRKISEIMIIIIII